MLDTSRGLGCSCCDSALAVYDKYHRQLTFLLTNISLLLDCSPAEIDAAEEAGETSKAEQLRKARRAELIRKLRQMQRKNVQQGRGGKAAAAVSSSGKLSRAEVGEADVARIISSWTGRLWD